MTIEEKNKNLSQDQIKIMLKVARELIDMLDLKNQRLKEKLALILEDADIWIPQMREAVGKDHILIEARMENLEAWHIEIKKLIKEQNDI